MLLLADQDRYMQCVDEGYTRLMAMGGVVPAEMAYESEELVVRGSDAIIAIGGPTTYRSSFWTWLTGGASYQMIMAQLEMAESMPEVKRIVFHLDSPGGEVRGIRELNDVMKACTKDKVAVVDNMAASAGYWIASQCNRIVAIPSGEVGSIGAMIMLRNFHKALEQNGIEISMIRSAVSPNKNEANPYEPLSDKAKDYWQKRVDKSGELFVSMVAEGRGITTDEVLSKFGQGFMLTAEDALEAGMIDEIGTLRDVLSTAQSTSTRRPSRQRIMETRV